MDAVVDTTGKPAEGGGTGGTDGALQPWLEQVEQSLRGSEVLKGIKGGVNELAKTHIETVDKFGKLEGEHKTLAESVKGMVKVPGKDATPEEIKLFHTQMGAPEKPEEYEFPEVEGRDNNPELVKFVSNLFFKHHLPKEVAKDIGLQWNLFLKGVEEQEDKLALDEIEKSKKDFRALFPNDGEHNAAVELGKRYWDKVIPEISKDYKISPETIKAFLDGTGLTGDPIFNAFIHYHAKKFGEDTSPPGSKGTGGATKSGMVYDRTPQHQK
jgi:hypothetical protein